MADGPFVVTGASGFVGAALVRHLHAQGHRIIAVSRHRCDVPAGVRLVMAPSYEDAGSLDAAMAGASAVLHLASIAHRAGGADEYAGSVRAAQAVAVAAVQARVPRLVLTSSIGVNGNLTQGVPFTEQSPARPVEAYAQSKLAAEQAVMATTRGTGTTHVVVRPPLVYGPHAPGNFGKLLRAVRRGLPLPLASVRNARTFISLDNLLDLLELCATHPAAADQLFLAGDTEDLSTPAFVRCLGDGLGRPARMLPFPPQLLQAAAALAGRRRLAESLCGSLQVDVSKARRLLGWAPRVAAAEGVRRAALADRLP